MRQYAAGNNDGPLFYYFFTLELLFHGNASKNIEKPGKLAGTDQEKDKGRNAVDSRH